MNETLKKSFYKNRYLAFIAISLYMLSLLFSASWSFNRSHESIQKSFEQYLNAGARKFESFAADKVTLQAIYNQQQTPTSEYLFDQQSQPTALFVYTRNDIGNYLLTYWNNNKTYPQPGDLAAPDGSRIVQYNNGYFQLHKRTITVQGTPVTIVGLIPVYWHYFFNNEYLVNDFPALKDGDSKYDINLQKGDIPINNISGKPSFFIVEKKQVHDYLSNSWGLFFKILSIAFLLVFVNMLAFDVAKAKGWLTGFAFLAVTVSLLRLATYVFRFALDFRKLELFDPNIYASDEFVHPSLGDLFINMILLFWMVSFIKYTSIQVVKQQPAYRGNQAVIVTVVVPVLMVLMSFAAAGIIRSLIVDSKISFDVSNFFRLSFFSLISFITLCFITLSFFIISNLLLLHVYKCKNIPVYAKFLVVAIFGLMYLTVHFDQYTLESNLVVLVWLLLFLFILEFRRADIYIPLMRSSFFLPWLILFASSISALVIYQTRAVELEHRKAHAVKLASQFDPASNNILRIGIAQLNGTYLTNNFNRFYNEVENKKIKDSLIKENFSAYLNKYDTRFYTFDSSSRALFNEDSTTYELVLNNIANRTKKTDTPDIFYYENAYDRFSFFFNKEVKDTAGNTLGYFFALANPKKYKSESLSPELFKESRDDAVDYDITSAYAIYNKGDIVDYSGDYNFISHINTSAYKKRDFNEVQKNGYSELWHNAGKDKMVVIVKSSSLLYQAITLFAYLFGTFLFIVVLFHGTQFLVRSRFRWKRIVGNVRLNIRNQIQATIIFISLFSFVVIAVATILFYINRFEKTNRQRLVKSITMMANEIKTQISRLALSDDVLQLHDIGPRDELKRNINEIAEIHNIDVNFYDLSGKLIVSTQPYVYQKDILSSMLEPRAYEALHYKKEIQVIQQEEISNISFTSIYAPVRDAAGQTRYYLNVPYLTSRYELNQEISSFLVTLINLNAFIFVFAGAIALLVTSRITSSFTLIGSKMKDVHLGKANEEIEWSTNDEIGALVNEYNKMVRKLEESAQALAKSEREGAWREMAKQVAHEIKNPLTPMKLSIQYLQRNIQENHPGIKQLSRQVADTLVEQIDQLAKIASDFSQFANIGQGRVEVFDVHEVLGSLVNLYSANEQMELVWNKHNQPAIIQADRSQVNRLFTNLLQNAVEASGTNSRMVIVVNETITGNKLHVTITDTGQGIPAEKLDKIFTPNFTTKSSGTGLGLAICKGIVEKANGRIWFDTIEGSGTSFHVLLPLIGMPA